MPHSEFGITIGHNIQHGRKNNMTIVEREMTVSTNGSRYRNFILKINVNWEGEELPSGMSAYLYVPRETYVDDSGNVQPLNKWGTYGIDMNAIPSEPSNPELRRETPDSEFSVSRWLNRYWKLSDGGVYRDDIDRSQADETANPGWPGLRYCHDYHYGSDYDGVELITRTLRVAARISGNAEKYALFFTMYRGARTCKYVFQFDLRGTETGNDLVEAAYIPVAIIYSPPGQDMTNSLVESQSHGTRVSFGQSIFEGAARGMQTSVGASGQYSMIGLNGSFEEGTSDSQSVTIAANNTLLFRTTQETMITANNQTAIGRGYWGPLGDLFVIIKDYLFYVSQVFDQDTGFLLVPIDYSPRAKKIIASTHELLQPSSGSLIADIPWADRRKILKLNPFVVKDDTILDAVQSLARPLSDAIDANGNLNSPSNPTRVVKVLSLDMGLGSELNFYESKSVSLNREESHTESYQTKFNQAGNVGLSIGVPVVGINFGTSLNSEQTLEFQTTLEMAQEESKTETAKCYLIRNQVDKTVGSVDVYYDNLFGTFLFKTTRRDFVCFQIFGWIYMPVLRKLNQKPDPKAQFKSAKQAIPYASIKLTFDQYKFSQTVTANQLGKFSFCVDKSILKPGTFELSANGKNFQVKLTEKEIKDGFMRFDLDNVKKIIDMKKLRYIDLINDFDVPATKIRREVSVLRKLKTPEDFGKFVGYDGQRLKDFVARHDFKPLK